MATRFLIVRLDGLGDTILTTPLLRAIRDHWADAHVTVIASPAGEACLRDHPGVDELLVHAPGGTTLSDKFALGRQLRQSRPDIAISVTEKAWGYVWLRMSAAPRRVGFWVGAEKPAKSLLFLPTLTDRVAEQPLLAEAERQMKLLEPLGVHVSAGPLWLARPMGPGDGAVALHLSAKWLSGGWEESWLLDLVRRLAQEHPVLLTAGALEAGWARSFCARARDAAQNVESLLDASYEAWTRRLAGCRLLVSMDTGAVHVAAGLGLPVVDVFPRPDAERCVPRWKPWMVAHQVVLRDEVPSASAASACLQEIVDASRTVQYRNPHVPSDPVG